MIRRILGTVGLVSLLHPPSIAGEPNAVISVTPSENSLDCDGLFLQYTLSNQAFTLCINDPAQRYTGECTRYSEIKLHYLNRMVDKDCTFSEIS